MYALEPMSCPHCHHLIDPEPEPSFDVEHQTFLGVDDSGNMALKKCDDNDAIKSQMDSRIDRMDHLIDSLLQQRAIASRVRNQYTTVGRLPVEILSEIFRCAFYVSGQDEVTYPHPTTLPLLLGRICSEWRNIAWGLSELWSAFHCRVSQKKILVQEILLKEWIDRSKTRLLSIRISLEDEDSWSTSSIARTQIIEALIPHCHRWRVMNIILPETWYSVLENAKGKLDNLASLIIRPPGYIFILKSLNIFSDAPRLKSLGSSHYYLHDLEYPWHQLTVASLGTASTDEALELIRRCPNLISCRFEDLNATEGNFPLDNVFHPDIQHITISLDPYTFLSPFLGYLTMPKLCILELTLPETHQNPLPTLESLIERSECPLKTIQITGLQLESDEMIDFLTYNQGVITISNNPSNKPQDLLLHP